MDLKVGSGGPYKRIQWVWCMLYATRTYQSECFRQTVSAQLHCKSCVPHSQAMEPLQEVKATAGNQSVTNHAVIAVKGPLLLTVFLSPLCLSQSKGL